mmetsp:Transcript_29922/g.43772  ORF Transcript_29922/g.43772 Transcript_29922/m.43772 type:complete len:201 (-) Transcript_29922:535-1137(-)
MRKPEQPHAVLEQELETLTTATGQDQGEDEVRKRMRVIKNRLSAKKSREQARDYVLKLEGSFSTLMAQHQSLARRLAMVEYENLSLRQHMYFSQPSTPSQNHVEQPAVLSKSPQLDAVLALVWATSIMAVIGLFPAQTPKSLVSSMSAPMPQAWAARTSPGPLRQMLLRAWLLGWVEHRPRCQPSIPRPHQPHLAATAAA